MRLLRRVSRHTQKEQKVEDWYLATLLNSRPKRLLLSHVYRVGFEPLTCAQVTRMPLGHRFTNKLVAPETLAKLSYYSPVAGCFVPAATAARLQQQCCAAGLLAEAGRA
jgi:hypothetical protein